MIPVAEPFHIERRTYTLKIDLEEPDIKKMRLLRAKDVRRRKRIERLERIIRTQHNELLGQLIIAPLPLHPARRNGKPN